MQASQLRRAGDLASIFGAKSLCYGGPGLGKTPLINTAPRPVMCAIEPGLLSMRGSNVPTWQAFTPATIDEFFKWLFGSREATYFDTVCIDSGSQMAEVYLSHFKPITRDGRQLYGKLYEAMMPHMYGMYFMPQKHIYIICKRETLELPTQTGGTTTSVRPYFPGKALNVSVPHLFDEVLHMELAAIPNVGTMRALRTRETFGIIARDRSGRLDEFEPCDLTALFNKVMG